MPSREYNKCFSSLRFHDADAADDDDAMLIILIIYSYPYNKFKYVSYVQKYECVIDVLKRDDSYFPFASLAHFCLATNNSSRYLFEIIFAVYIFLPYRWYLHIFFFSQQNGLNCFQVGWYYCSVWCCFAVKFQSIAANGIPCMGMKFWYSMETTIWPGVDFQPNVTNVKWRERGSGRTEIKQRRLYFTWQLNECLCDNQLWMEMNILQTHTTVVMKWVSSGLGKKER